MCSVLCVRQSAYDVSPCLSGDCFVDLNTAQFLQQSTSRRQKRALFVDFTAIPNHKWATNIPVYFNFTGVSTGVSFMLFVLVKINVLKSFLLSKIKSFQTLFILRTLPYLALPPGWTGSYTCPALKPYQFGPMRVPECNHKVTGIAAIKP